MIVFRLTMPHVNSWNGRWSQEDELHIRTMDERQVPKEVWDKDFYHHWDDGWTACVSVERMSASEARKLERKSKGFCGYDWMIRTIVKDGYIHYERKEE